MNYSYDKYSTKKQYSSPSQWQPDNEKGGVVSLPYGQLVEPLFDSSGFKCNTNYDIKYYELDKYSPVYDNRGSFVYKYVFRQIYNQSNYQYLADVYKKTATENIVKDQLIQQNIIAENGTYPDNGPAGDGYWYIKKGVINNSPSISGIDQDLGDKSSPFSVQYILSDIDMNDTLTSVEKIDGNIINTINNAARSKLYTINITQDILNTFNIGSSHTITITVNDSNGGTSTRSYTFKRINTPPTISGIDQDLGYKVDTFTITYQVDDQDNDVVTVTELLNGNIIRTLNNVPKKQDIQLVLTQETVCNLTLFSTNLLQIQAVDIHGGKTIRTYFFVRGNSAPVISGSDKDIGKITSSFAQNYIITDAEGDSVVIVEKIDDKIIRTFNTVLGKENIITIPNEVWWETTIGNHTLRIEATDIYGGISVRTYTFTRLDDSIEFTLKKPYETDIQALKILVEPVWTITNEGVKVEACNNGFDDTLAWEDVTNSVLQNEYYSFKNTSKTAENWGVNIRFTIIKSDQAVSIKAFSIWVEE